MRIRYLILLFVLLSLIGGGAYLLKPGMYDDAVRIISSYVKVGKPSAKPGTAYSLLKNNILARLGELEVPDSAVSIHARPTDSIVDIRAAVPRGEPIEMVLWRLSAAAVGTSYRIDDCFCPADERSCTVRFSDTTRSRRAVVILTLARSPRFLSKSAKLAIVITDFASTDSKIAAEYLSINEPLTIGFVPGTVAGPLARRAADDYKKEVVILLPMEPVRGSGKEFGKSKIMIHFTGKRLHSIIRNAMESIPDFAGFSNWGGARVLEDSRVMTIIYSDIKKHHGYFLEQGTSRKSVAATLARRLDLPFGEVDRSLDSVRTEGQIQDYLIRYGMEAQKRGRIIIASKATTEFLDALKRELPSYRRNGIRLAFVSEMLGPAEGEVQSK